MEAVVAEVDRRRRAMNFGPRDLRGALRGERYEGEKLSGLREGLLEEQIVEKHDALVEKAISESGAAATPRERIQHLRAQAQVYADELNRREAERQGTRMEKLTKSMNRLTWAAVAVAVVGVILSLLTLLTSG